jgi:hypothetical protein
MAYIVDILRCDFHCSVIVVVVVLQALSVFHQTSPRTSDQNVVYRSINRNRPEPSLSRNTKEHLSQQRGALHVDPRNPAEH